MNTDTASRINKYLALQLGVSRREADDLVAGGSVSINGEVATNGSRVNPGDKVTVDGTPITPKTSHTTISMNKPRGYVCSRRRQGEAPTIYELLPEEYRMLKAVGRLDKDSSGIILLSDDGDLAHRMTHPSFHKQKIYEVSLNLPLQPLHRQMISDYGVMLEDGKSQFQLERINDDDDTYWRITMSEGRNRQIRRTFASLGYDIVTLHRTEFGQYICPREGIEVIEAA